MANKKAINTVKRSKGTSSRTSNRKKNKSSKKFGSLLRTKRPDLYIVATVAVILVSCYAGYQFYLKNFASANKVYPWSGVSLSWTPIGKSVNAKGVVVDTRACISTPSLPVGTRERNGTLDFLGQGYRDTGDIRDIIITVRPTSDYSRSGDIGGVPKIITLAYVGPIDVVTDIRKSIPDENLSFGAPQNPLPYKKYKWTASYVSFPLVVNSIGDSRGRAFVGLTDLVSGKDNYIAIVHTDYTKTAWQQTQPYSLKELNEQSKRLGCNYTPPAAVNNSSSSSEATTPAAATPTRGGKTMKVDGSKATKSGSSNPTVNKGTE